MSQELLYAVGTILTWIGWGALLVTVFRLVGINSRPAGIARTEATRAAASSAATAGICLIVAAGLPMGGATKETGIHFPIIWIVLPFVGWASLACVGIAVHRLFMLIVSSGLRTEAQLGAANRWSRQLIWSFLGAVAFAFLFKYEVNLAIGGPDPLFALKPSDNKLDIIRGAITMSPTVALSLVILAVATTTLMAIWGRQARTRGLAKTVASHIALVIGSIVFGLPFAWLVVTSFKEDRDMSSAEGLVWIPKVSETVPFRNPEDPLYEGTYKGQAVQARVIDKLANGQLHLDISKPMVLRGATFDAAPADLKEIDDVAPVVTGKYKDVAVTGMVVKNLEDGSQTVRITEPVQLRGTEFTGSGSDFEPVRHIGLNWKNYPDSLDYLPAEANKGLTYLQNTLIIVILSLIGSLVSSSIVAYAFARLQFPSKKLLFSVLLSTMMLPAAVTLLPTFLIFKYMGWIDTLYPLWVPTFFAGAFNVFLLRQFFITVPKELEDASKIDGCSHFGTFWSVMLPQVKPALAVIAIFTVMGVWNNFMGPLVYINSPEHMPIAYAVQLYQGQRSGEPGLLMAFATMSMLPVLALFFFAQRYFVEGVTLSGLGGR